MIGSTRCCCSHGYSCRFGLIESSNMVPFRTGCTPASCRGDHACTCRKAMSQTIASSLKIAQLACLDNLSRVLFLSPLYFRRYMSLDAPYSEVIQRPFHEHQVQIYAMRHFDSRTLESQTKSSPTAMQGAAGSTFLSRRG